jgi:hypothetical protein
VLQLCCHLPRDILLTMFKPRSMTSTLNRESRKVRHQIFSRPHTALMTTSLSIPWPSRPNCSPYTGLVLTDWDDRLWSLSFQSFRSLQCVMYCEGTSPVEVPD